LNDRTGIIQEIYDDLGVEAYKLILQKPELYQSVKIDCCSICKLPDSMPQFDRIFCISTLEHMTEADQKTALLEFSRKLKPDGLIVLTTDYPVVTPEALLKTAKSAGLVPAGPVENYKPGPNAITFMPDGRTTNIQLNVYRCVLKRE
jgi:ubiquinone/menaquinone biosynthesis C-methylase UbiE